jgi:hypothetical protein
LQQTIKTTQQQTIEAAQQQTIETTQQQTIETAQQQQNLITVITSIRNEEKKDSKGDVNASRITRLIRTPTEQIKRQWRHQRKNLQKHY